MFQVYSYVSYVQLQRLISQGYGYYKIVDSYSLVALNVFRNLLSYKRYSFWNKYTTAEEKIFFLPVGLCLLLNICLI